MSSPFAHEVHDRGDLLAVSTFGPLNRGRANGSGREDDGPFEQDTILKQNPVRYVPLWGATYRTKHEKGGGAACAEDREASDSHRGPFFRSFGEAKDRFASDKSAVFLSSALLFPTWILICIRWLTMHRIISLPLVSDRLRIDAMAGIIPVAAGIASNPFPVFRYV